MTSTASQNDRLARLMGALESGKHAENNGDFVLNMDGDYPSGSTGKQNNDDELIFTDIGKLNTSPSVQQQHAVVSGHSGNNRGKYGANVAYGDAISKEMELEIDENPQPIPYLMGQPPIVHQPPQTLQQVQQTQQPQQYPHQIQQNHHQNTQNQQHQQQQFQQVIQPTNYIPSLGYRAGKTGAAKAKMKGKQQQQQVSVERERIKMFQDEELGEVGEWIEKSANVKENQDEDDFGDDPDFDVDNENHTENHNRVMMTNNLPKPAMSAIQRASAENDKGPAPLPNRNIKSGSQNRLRKGDQIVNSLAQKAKLMSLMKGGEEEVGVQQDAARNQQNAAIHEEEEAEEEQNYPKNQQYQQPELAQHESQEPMIPDMNNYYQEAPAPVALVNNDGIEFDPFDMDNIPVIQQIPEAEQLQHQQQQPEDNQQGQEYYQQEENQAPSPAMDFMDQYMIPVNVPEEVKIQERPSTQRNMISFAEAWKIVKNMDLSAEKGDIVTADTNNMSWFEKLISPCLATKLPPHLLTERDQIFAYAKVKYSDTTELPFKMLSTIYQILTGNSYCPRRGSHWEIIGFQGDDPARDLRGVGMLSVLQILAFLSFNKEFLLKVHEFLNTAPTTHFPLCGSLLGVTKCALQTMREGKLNTLIRQQNSAVNPFNNFYFGVFFKFFMYYKLNNLTIKDFGVAFKQISEECKLNPAGVINEFQEMVQNFGVMLFEN